ncbi:hypothetical protein OEZ85_014325 [Tetradesmus obliquus]|uniref:CCHC-type domain-containing protein n=1 Tax=Tetradesmus obliquus TaxID=3088 RepID=A0ABY8U7Q3_TETOB|nr:hypothetical protein OEZ85_014325 [Tetradesmus obliquus]
MGHVAAACKEPYCSTCKLNGHPDGTCSSACRNCGKVHADVVRPKWCGPRGPCFGCQLWGHEKVLCPVLLAQQRCSKCNFRGHRIRDCPGYCTRCRKHGHMLPQCTAKPCPACLGFGHEAGSPECGRHSSSSSRRPAAEAGSRGQQQGAAVAGAAAPAAAAAAAAGRVPFKASSVRLQPGEPDENQRGEFIEKFFDANSPALQAYAMGLIEQRMKAAVLSRLSAADLAQILEQDDPVATLEEVYRHFAIGRMGSMQPANLQPEGQRALEEALPRQLRVQLKPGWGKAHRWGDVALQLQEAAAGGSWGKADRDAFEEAEARARQASFDAETALKEQRAQQETQQQAPQQQQQQQQREQQQHGEAGATYVINQLVEEQQMREYLLLAGVQPAADMQVAPLLHGVVRSPLKSLKASNEENFAIWASRLPYKQIVAAARQRVEGVEVWITVQSCIGLAGDIPALIKALYSNDGCNFIDRKYGRVDQADVRDLLHLSINSSSTIYH